MTTATEPTPIAVEYTDGSPLPADDPRVTFARSVQVARAVVAEIDETNAAAPTPCPEWDALTMARHMIAILDRVTGVSHGRDLMAMPVFTDVPTHDLVDAFDGAAARLHDAWSDPALLEREMTLPFGVLPGAAVMGAYSAELLVHTWDLATAIDVAPDWHDADCDGAAQMVRFAIPAEPRGGEMPFTDVVDVGADAPPIERLVAWLGRDPQG
jgi:uncharacterized protein (TIGR03086 family)